MFFVQIDADMLCCLPSHLQVNHTAKVREICDSCVVNA